MRVCRQELIQAHRLPLAITLHKHCTCCPGSASARQPSTGESECAGLSSTSMRHPSPLSLSLSAGANGHSISQTIRSAMHRENQSAPAQRSAHLKGGEINGINSVKISSLLNKFNLGQIRICALAIMGQLDELLQELGPSSFLIFFPSLVLLVIFLSGRVCNRFCI